MTSGTDTRRRETGYGQSNFQAPGKVNGGKGAWGGYHTNHGGYNHGSQQQQNGAGTTMPLATALKGVEEATAATEHAFRCAAAAVENNQASKADVEGVLNKLCSLLPLPVNAQMTQLAASSPLPGAIVRTIKRFQGEASCAALACCVAVRTSGSLEAATSQIRAGALDEVNSLMDRHASHGGVQNVSLLMLAGLLKDNSVARQAVSSGSVNRVISAMELTTGREVHYNGLQVLKLLLDSGRNNRAFLQDNPRAPRANLQEAALRAKAAHETDSILCNSSNDVLALVTPRFKEVLCWHWQSGWCKLGPRCTYAHGQSDLRGNGTGAGDGRAVGGPEGRGGKGAQALSEAGGCGCGAGGKQGGKGRDLHESQNGKGAAEAHHHSHEAEGQKGSVKGGKGGYGKRGDS